MDFHNSLPKPELNTAQEDFLQSLTALDAMNQREIAMKMMELGTDPKVQELESQIPFARDTEQTATIIRKLLVYAGTDVNRNDKDPFGDGDQTILLGKKNESKRQILRNLFSSGGDIEQYLMAGTDGLTSFAWSCVKGDTKSVENTLNKTRLKGQQAIVELTESRQTSMRLPPLLLTVALSKHKQTVRKFTQREVKDMDHVGVFRTLIKYGARPDAKDVTGKTVCHYGAGCMATDETLEMTKMAIEATKTCYYFGHEIVLNGLTKTEYNGIRGTLGGYVEGKDRRVIYPVAGSVVEHELSLKLENIFIEKDDGNERKKQICILKASKGRRLNLIDNRDRVGSISLHEVAMSQRGEVAKFLCKHSATCLDVADGGGITIRQMMCNTFPLGNNTVATVLKRHAAKQAKKQESKVACENCGKQGSMFQCSRCNAVAYCSKECQVTHWKSQHKKECKRIQNEEELVLGQPKKLDPNLRSIFGSSDAKFKCGPPNYGPPNVLTSPGELFWIKVQSNGIRQDLMIYDKSRTCNFYLPPGQSGHRELVETVSQQKAFLGRKSFFKAKFDKKGRCVVYPRTSTALKW